MGIEEKIDAELRAALSNLPDPNLDDLRAARSSLRAAFQRLQSVVDPIISISELTIPGSLGMDPIRMRLYRPKVKDKERPGLLWIHGGGYVLGTPEMDDAICQRFVTGSDCIVVSVDYRLAPEHPFPAGVEDCYAALLWLSDNSEGLGIDTSRLAVAGASAGGGLAAAVALIARDRQGPPLIFQMPLYPMIDDRNITPSSYEITDKRLWNRDANIKGWKMYLDGQEMNEVSPYAAPSRATDLSGLPPTFTCVGVLDVFRDEIIDYVARLCQAGVPTEFHMYPGCFHGFETMAPNAGVSIRAESQYVEALKRAFHDGV